MLLVLALEKLSPRNRAGRVVAFLLPSYVEPETQTHEACAYEDNQKPTSHFRPPLSIKPKRDSRQKSCRHDPGEGNVGWKRLFPENRAQNRAREDELRYVIQELGETLLLRLLNGHGLSLVDNPSKIKITA